MFVSVRVMHCPMPFFDWAGRDLIEYRMKIIIERVYSFATVAERQIVPDVKEKFCYIALDFDIELKKAGESSDEEKTHELPDENITIVGSEVQTYEIGVQTDEALDSFEAGSEVLRCSAAGH